MGGLNRLLLLLLLSLYLALNLAFDGNEEVRTVAVEEGVTEDTLSKLIARLVEAIHIELSDEAIHLTVTEVPRQHHLLELTHILYDELTTRCPPENYLTELLILNQCSLTLKI